MLNLTGLLRRAPFRKDKKKTMAKYSKKQRENKSNILAGIEKFRNYATPRGFYMKEGTYGVYNVTHNGHHTKLEAVRAARTEADGRMTKGWIINVAGRQRTFKPDGSGWEVHPIK